jgi:hypothetical protein
MESSQVTAILLAGIICGTITIGVIAQAWVIGRQKKGLEAGPVTKRLDALEDRLYRLEQAVDTVAVELERGTEAQRFTAKLLAERLEVLPAARIGSPDAER